VTWLNKLMRVREQGPSVCSPEKVSNQSCNRDPMVALDVGDLGWAEQSVTFRMQYYFAVEAES
jgi:hypothetical protein